MKHYEKLDPTDVRGVIFDIDDTVTSGGVLDPEAFAAMHRLSRLGFDLVAVTGRPLGWTDVIARMWPVRVAIGENGAGWAWTDGIRVLDGYFDDRSTREAHHDVLERIRAAVSDAMPHVRLANDRGARRCDLAFDIGEEVTLPPNEIDTLIALIERNGAASSVSTVHAHAVPGSWNKARGAQRALREVLDLDLDAELGRWVFVGDSGNDAAAFTHFPLSVGVANVRAHLARLPTPPRFVTDAERGRGFAELATHLCQARD
ncbi:MAG: HAD-IIB family hydrolase [Polyangiales bacterium]